MKSRFIILALLFMFYSCEKEKQFTRVNCSECYTDKPKYGPLYVIVSLDDKNESIPVVIYKGDIFKGEIMHVDTITTNDYFVDVKVGVYHSITAEYNVDNKKIVAVDGTKIKTRLVTDECDDNCYRFRKNYLDVKLKKF